MQKTLDLPGYYCGHPECPSLRVNRTGSLDRGKTCEPGMDPVLATSSFKIEREIALSSTSHCTVWKRSPVFQSPQ